MEDGEHAVLQGLALVLHLTEVALQIRHLAADGLQLLLQHCGQKLRNAGKTGDGRRDQE